VSAPPADELLPLPRFGRVYERTERAGLADADPAGRVRLDALARWLQNVAYADVVDAGVDGLGVWVVRRTRVRVERFPRFGEDVRLRTFCSGMGRLVAERSTVVESSGGGCARAVSLWVFLDPETRRPAALDERFGAVYGEAAGKRRVRSRLRHPAPDGDLACEPWRFRAADLDLADHVNNAAYWTVLEECLAGRAVAEPYDAEIEFRDAAQPGEAAVLRDGASTWVTDPAGTVLASLLVRS